MLENAKCFRAEKVKTELCSDLLMSVLLEMLCKNDMINPETYVKAVKEVQHYDESTISK